MTIIEIRDAIVGKSRDDAYLFLEKAEIQHRVSHINGEARVLTRDYKPERVNLILEDGKVVDFTMG